MKFLSIVPFVLTIIQLHFVSDAFSEPILGAYPITSLDLSSNQDDLTRFGQLTKSATIVALGEDVHTDGSFHQMNARLARFLIEKKGFRKLLLETPWAQAEKLSSYINECNGSTTLLEGMQSIFPQFSSLELASLFQWVSEFNCSHPLEKVQFAGFDIQQYSGLAQLPFLLPFDEKNLEDFVQISLPTLAPRISELRLCGPGPGNNWKSGPENAEELKICQKFLLDLEPFILKTLDKYFSLKSSLIALRYYAAMTATRGSDKRASGGWRDLGMAEMIQHIISSSIPLAKTIVLAHTGHVSRDFQDISNFATKSMGTYLGNVFGDKYFVAVSLSLQPSGASWWLPLAPLQPPAADDIETLLNSANLGSFILDLHDNSLFKSDVPTRWKGNTHVVLARHFDAITFIPKTSPMTNYPEVIYPTPPNFSAYDPSFESCSSEGSMPSGWSLFASQGITIGCDSSTKRTGQWSISLVSSESHPEGGGITQCRPANGFEGPLRINGNLKSSQVNGGVASIGIIAVGSNGNIIAKTDFSTVGVSGTTEWIKFSASIVIPPNALYICWGLTLTGSGKAWGDDLSLIF